VIVALLITGVAHAFDLPPRPEQAELDARSCPEAAVVSGEVDELMPTDCDGIVLSLQVWAHLEALAVDSRTVRSHFDLMSAAHKEQIARLDWQVEQLTKPIPWHERPGWRGAAVAAGVLTGVILYEASTRAIPE